MGKFSQYIFVAVFLGVELYSITSAFKHNSMEYYEGGFFGYIIGNAIVLGFGIIAPIYVLMWPIIVIMGLVMPIAGLAMIWGKIFGSDNDSPLLISIGLCVGGYYYTTKISLPITKDVIQPAIDNFLKTFFEILLISQHFNEGKNQCSPNGIIKTYA